MTETFIGSHPQAAAPASHSLYLWLLAGQQNIICCTGCLPCSNIVEQAEPACQTRKDLHQMRACLPCAHSLTHRPSSAPAALRSQPSSALFSPWRSWTLHKPEQLNICLDLSSHPEHVKCGWNRNTHSRFIEGTVSFS